jgi:predicted Kef-type K+ transport protein
MDPIWITVAFAFGLLGRFIGLPPLVGFLAAGFVLNGFVTTELESPDGESLDVLQTWSDYGVYLLLFSIGLKLRLKTLTQPVIWAGTSIHMAITVLFMGGLLFALGLLGVTALTDLDLTQAALIGFALSFSSTVFAVKVLDERGEMNALHGRTAIGILIMQDIIAIVFLTLSSGNWPSPWAATLLALPLLRPVLNFIMDRCGHGELLVLYGLLLTIAGVIGFKALGMKPDLGALVIGILVGQHPKASEMAKMLFGFKELFLVGFFLNIGFSSSPSIADLGIALLLMLAIPIKVFLFYLLFTRHRMRARTSTLASLSLANYSEFGLIVGAVAVSSGWMEPRWLGVIAIALALSFIIAAPINSSAHALYAKLQTHLKRFESDKRLPEDQPLDVGDADILVFGMGRVGTAAYDELHNSLGPTVLGLDFNSDNVHAHQQAGRRVARGDASDRDFWDRLSPGKIKLVLLAMEDHEAHLYAARQLADSHFDGKIAATASFADEQTQLQDAGVDQVFNLRSVAGTAFGEAATQALNKHQQQE